MRSAAALVRPYALRPAAVGLSGPMTASGDGNRALKLATWMIGSSPRKARPGEDRGGGLRVDLPHQLFATIVGAHYPGGVE